MTARRIAFFLAAALFVLALLMVFTNLHVMRSQTNNESQVASSRMEEASTTLGQPDTINVYIEPGGRLQEALAEEIEQRRAASVPQIGQIELVSSPDAQPGQPLAYVDVKEQNVRWTPFFARAALQVEVSFSTNGSLPFRDQQPAHFEQIAGAEAIQYAGKYTTSDVSYGLIAMPGYYEFLAGKVADQIFASMQQELER